MAKLKIEHIGPIKSGCADNDGFIDFDGVTVFIGNQGTGKSTISKLFSTLSWLEKALFRGDFTINYLSQYNRFKKQLAYQNIGNYLSDESLIDYIGDAFRIKYAKGKLEITEQHQQYSFPKIMYVPAERNFVSTVDRPDLVKRLPLPIYTFLEEYEFSKQNLTETVHLPVGNLRFEYRKANKKSFLVGEGFRIDLLEASSGYQSLVPLFLVTNSLAKTVTEDSNTAYNERNFVDQHKLRAQIDKILANDSLTEDIKRILLEKISQKNSYSSFVNIVEEPEQNLYPTSQKDILQALLKNQNLNEHNRLVITTHSPYIINYLTLSIKAFLIKELVMSRNLESELANIVDLDATINPSIVNIYQLEENGVLSKLENYQGLPSDENYLNNFLASFNDDFVRLIRLEQQCR